MNHDDRLDAALHVIGIALGAGMISIGGIRGAHADYVVIDDPMPDDAIEGTWYETPAEPKQLTSGEREA